MLFCCIAKRFGSEDWAITSYVYSLYVFDIKYIILSYPIASQNDLNEPEKFAGWKNKKFK